MTTWKKVLGACIFIVFAGISSLFYWFYHLEVYWQESGTVTNGKLKYTTEDTMFQKYIHGEFRDGKIIGRFRGDHLWGFKTLVRSVKGHDDLISVRGLMYDDILKKTGK